MIDPPHPIGGPSSIVSEPFAVQCRPLPEKSLAALATLLWTIGVHRLRFVVLAGVSRCTSDSSSESLSSRSQTFAPATAKLP